MIKLAQMSSRAHTLRDEHVPEELREFNTLEQRTADWWKRRSGKLSGSKLSQLFFLQSDKEWNEYRNEVFGTGPRKPLDADAMVRVKFGVDNEPNALATLLHHCQDMHAWEVGFEIHPIHTFLGSSPDGIVHWPSGGGWAALEIKCSTKKNAKGHSVPHVGVPYYYIPQLHAEMQCAQQPGMEGKCRSTIFVSYSQTITKIYRVHFNDELWAILWESMVRQRRQWR